MYACVKSTETSVTQMKCSKILFVKVIALISYHFFNKLLQS
jgi:hypothetical protein